MKLFLLITVTMIAFAANSVLNRVALADGAIDPASFAALRIASGALILAALTLYRKRAMKFDIGGTLSLSVYMVGFSFAYVTLDTGVGALILFGGVQVTMFIGALLKGENLPTTRWGGAIIAFCGLVVLMWPSGPTEVAFSGALMMAAAAIGWGVYSLIGKGAVDPIASTASNFLYSVPLGLATLLLVQEINVSSTGVALAVASGAITSGLGYALWYMLLPKLTASMAAIVMLTVPVIATVGGVVFLGETVGLQFAISTLLVLGGVLVAAKPARM